jgi:protein-S-isoprenylcysteine O-methyltransferase Ste14
MSHLDAPTQMPPDHIGVLAAGLVMMVGGWLGLFHLVTTTLPRVGQRWVFFMLLCLAVTGTVLPLVRYLNVRFTPPDIEPPPGGVIVRQSVWFGLFVITCAWLQIPRALSLPIAFLVGLVFFAIEIFLRSREIRNERND